MTPWTTAHQAPLSMRILQARKLEWVAMSSSRGSSQLRDRTQVSRTTGDSLPSEPPGKPKNTGVGSLTLLWGIFQTQESDWGLLRCRQIPYQLSYQGSPEKYIWKVKKKKRNFIETNSEKSQSLDASYVTIWKNRTFTYRQQLSPKYFMSSQKIPFSYFSQASAARNMFAYKRIKCVHL